MADLGEALRDAAWDGQLEAVRTLLGQGADVDSRDGKQYTPLHLAAMYRHLEVAELLLDSGATVDALNCGKSTPLMWASVEGHLSVVKLLVARGANVNQKSEISETALSWAAQYDHLDVCLFLLSKGADLLTMSGKGRDALTLYGQRVNPRLSPEILADRRDALTAVWHAGPHPSQVQRRRDEAWDRRKSLMQVSAENGYRPLSHRQLAIALKAVADLSSTVAAQKMAVVRLSKDNAALSLLVAAQHQALLVAAAGGPVVVPSSQVPDVANPAAAIPGIEIDTPAKRHAHLLGQVLSNEGIHRHIVSFL